MCQHKFFSKNCHRLHHFLNQNSPFRHKQKYAWNTMIVCYVTSGVHLGRTQCAFYIGFNVNFATFKPSCNPLLCRILEYSKYHVKIQSLACRMQVVLSLDGLPTRSYSASKLTIHFTCTRVAKPKEVNQTTYNHLCLNMTLLTEV